MNNKHDIHNHIPQDDQNDESFLFLQEVQEILQEDRAPADLKQMMKADLRQRFDAERTTPARRPFFSFTTPPRTFYTAAGAFALVAIFCATYLLILNPPSIVQEATVRRTATPIATATATATRPPQELLEELFTAIREQDSTQVEALIEMGVDVNKNNAQGIPPLQASIFLDSPEEISILLIDAGAAVDEKIFGFGLRNREITQQLLQKMVDTGVDVHGYKYERKEQMATALMVATDAQNTTAATYLIEQGVDLNQADNRGLTALHIAAGKGYLDLVKQLVESGADVTIIDKQELTAAEKAKKFGYDDVVRYLDNN